MRPSGEGLPLVAAGTVAAAVALGGAFAPAERVVITAIFAVACGWAAVAITRGPTAGEWFALAVVGWGGASAALTAAYPFAAKQVLGGWLIGWALWLISARTPSERIRAVGLVVAATAAVVAAAVVLECLAAGRVRMGGVFVNPNVAAALLVPVWILGSVAFGPFPTWALLGAVPSVLLVKPVRWALLSPAEEVPIPAMGANVVWNRAPNALLGVGLLVAALLS